MKYGLHGPGPVLVGYHLDGRGRRWPIHWPAGVYELVDTVDIGGVYTGYLDLRLKHSESGFTDTLKSHQMAALLESGTMEKL